MRVYHGSIRAVQLGQPNLRDKGPAGKTNPVLPCVQIAAERVTVSPMRGGRTADDGFARSRSLLLPPVGHGLGVGCSVALPSLDTGSGSARRGVNGEQAAAVAAQ